MRDDDTDSDYPAFGSLGATRYELSRLANVAERVAAGESTLTVQASMVLAEGGRMRVGTCSSLDQAALEFFPQLLARAQQIAREDLPKRAKAAAAEERERHAKRLAEIEQALNESKDL